MNCKYTIKNFRVFNEEGATFELRPITILTGCNSSGKSSLVKSLVVLNDFLKQIVSDVSKKEDIDIGAYKLNFGAKHLLLGNTKSELNDHSKSTLMTFEFTVYALKLDQTISIRLIFDCDAPKIYNYGFIKSLQLLNTEGSVLYCANNKSENFGNFSIFKHNFFNSINALKELYKIDHNFYGHIDNQRERYSLITEKAGIYLKNIDLLLNSEYRDDTWGDDLTIDDINSCNKYIEFNTLHYLPILEKLSGINKKELPSYLRNLGKGLEIQHPLLPFCLSKIESSFKDSIYGDFLDFYRDLENRFLDNNNDASCNPYDKYNHLLHTWEEDLFITELEVYSPYQYNNFLEFLQKENKLIELENFKNQDLDFNLLYDTLIIINQTDNEILKYNNIDNERLSHHSSIIKLFNDWMNSIIKDVLHNDHLISITYSNSSLAEIKRMYTSEDKNELAILIEEFNKFYQNANTINIGKYEPNFDFINEWTKRLDIGDRIELVEDEETMGAKLKLFKDKTDKKGRILAFNGYGITQLFTILFRIQLDIIKNDRFPMKGDEVNPLTGKRPSKLFIDHLFYPSTIAYEEPECHLHPSLQSKLAEIFADAYLRYNINFIIETHSEYLIRKLQTLVKNKKVSKDDVSIIYVDHPDPSKRNSPYDEQVRQIYCEEDGQLTDFFGKGFFDESMRLNDELYSI